jgi:hypothetical protein
VKRVAWSGWLIAGLLIAHNAAAVLSAPAAGNPLEGHVLQYSTGALYVFHDGLKFSVESADVGDRMIDAIPNATSTQWKALFSGGQSVSPVAPPEPFPGHYS